MKKLFIYFFILGFHVDVCRADGGYESVFYKGVSLYEGLYTQNQESFSWKLDDLTASAQSVNRGYANLGAGDIYYSLYSNGEVDGVDIAKKQHIGTWKIIRTADDTESEIRKSFTIANAAEDDYAIDVSSLVGDSMGLGCLARYPVRYGDINRDEKQELILIPRFEEYGIRNNKQDFIVFSPVKNAVIFSARIVREDIGTAERVASEENSNFPQINSAVTEAGRIPAVRAYAKLYFNDFNKDGVADIIAWRKRYESRKINDAVKGFFLAQESMTHYQLIDGEYKKQETTQDVIKGWLTGKNLTWQQGWPSTSECPGEEGKLIPEMHDPLLNDPEVLQ